MTVAHALLGFTIAAALLTITPGLDTALVLRTAAVEGLRQVMLAGAGICSGLFTWALAVSVGLGALLAVSRFGYTMLRLVGAGYLIYLGTKIFFRAQPGIAQADLLVSMQSGSAKSKKDASRWFGRGFLTNVLNPKVGVFYVSFLPQFIPSGVHITSFSMLLASIHVVEGILWFLILIFATGLLSTWLQRPRVAKAIDCTTGAVLVGFGITLVFKKGH